MTKGQIVADNIGTEYEVVLIGPNEIVLQAGDSKDPEFYVFEKIDGVWFDANEPGIWIDENPTTVS